MVVHDLPITIELAPHVREARLHRLAIPERPRHEGVHSGVEVCIVAILLNVVGGDGAVGQLLEKVNKIFLSSLAVLNKLG